MKPTPIQFEAFQRLYDYFNRVLFKNELPDVILNFTRQNQTDGYFAPVRWKSSPAGHAKEKAGNSSAGDKQPSTGDSPLGGNPLGVSTLGGNPPEDNQQMALFGKPKASHPRRDEVRHEISIHPHCLCRGKQAFIQTLVHEMCHLWQHEYGHPSRTTYHNQEWADKMESVGLIPSTTGAPGGARTGQRMQDYVQKGGKLEKAIAAMPADLWLPFDALEYSAFDVTALEEWLHQIEQGALVSDHHEMAAIRQVLEGVREQKIKKRKMKYTCVGCNINVWGKPGLRLRCEDCDMTLLAVE